jgi:excisionase family DNA binding protein
MAVDKHVTCRQAADATGTSESFWRKLAARREIRTFKLGRATRLLEADVRRYLTDRERPAREMGR